MPASSRWSASLARPAWTCLSPGFARHGRGGCAMWRRLRIGRRFAALLVHSVLAATAVLSGGGVARASHNFSDVADSAFYHNFVDFLVQNGITGGCGPGLYCGEDAVTRGQVAVFLKRLALALGNCPPDSVQVGPTCVDKYEASVWEVP